MLHELSEQGRWNIRSDGARVQASYHLEASFDQTDQCVIIDRRCLFWLSAEEPRGLVAVTLDPRQRINPRTGKKTRSTQKIFCPRV